MPRTETATCQDCGWRGPVEDTKESAISTSAFIRAMSCPPATARWRDAAAPRCSTMSAVTRTICAPRWSRSCSASTGFMTASARAIRARRSAPTSRSLPTTPARHWRPDPRLQPVCNTCGGTGVQVDAWACWDVGAQGWVLHSTYEAAAICADCDVECSYTMKPVAEAA